MHFDEISPQSAPKKQFAEGVEKMKGKLVDEVAKNRELLGSISIFVSHKRHE